MAQHIVPHQSYIKANTSPDDYVIQNIGKSSIFVVISDTQPADNAPCDFVLEKYDGISSNEVIGTVWVKSSGNVDGLIGSVG